MIAYENMQQKVWVCTLVGNNITFQV